MESLIFIIRVLFGTKIRKNPAKCEECLVPSVPCLPIGNIILFVYYLICLKFNLAKIFKECQSGAAKEFIFRNILLNLGRYYSTHVYKIRQFDEY